MTEIDRYGTTVAPDGLGLVHRFLNTEAVGSQRVDQLTDLVGAQRWLDQVLQRWADETGRQRAEVRLTQADLPRLRNLRRDIRDTLTNDTAGTGLTVQVDISMGAESRASATPRGRTASAWLTSAILLESLTAQIVGTWPRLKVCANPDCDVVFYDRSRNQSGAWHDVHVCGNRINLRASRARHREAASGPRPEG